MDSNSEPKLISLISQLISFKEDTTDSGWESKMISLMIQVISVVSSMDLESQPKPESELMSLVTQAISVFNSMDLDSQPEPLSELISTFTRKLSIDSDSEAKLDSELLPLYYETFKLDPRPELISIIPHIVSLFTTTDPEFTPLVAETWRLKLPESEFISLLSQIVALTTMFAELSSELDLSEFLPKVILLISLISQMISLVSSLEFDSQPKPQTKVMSVLTQTISVANSISDSEPEWEFISLVTQFIALIRSIDPETPPPQLILLMNHVASHLYSLNNADSELNSLINIIFGLADPKDSEPEEEWELDQLISLSPQLKVRLVHGKFHVTGKVERKRKEKGECQPGNRQRVYLARGEDATHFLCKDCNGEDHEECEKTPIEVKHPLHLKHSLQLVSQKKRSQARKCFCCDEDLQKIFYYCEACDFAMNIACTDRPPVLSIDHPKWHKHTLSLFPRRAFLTCNVCPWPMQAPLSMFPLVILWSISDVSTYHVS